MTAGALSVGLVSRETKETSHREFCRLQCQRGRCSAVIYSLGRNLNKRTIRETRKRRLMKARRKKNELWGESNDGKSRFARVCSRDALSRTPPERKRGPIGHMIIYALFLGWILDGAVASDVRRLGPKTCHSKVYNRRDEKPSQIDDSSGACNPEGSSRAFLLDTSQPTHNPKLRGKFQCKT